MKSAQSEGEIEVPVQVDGEDHFDGLDEGRKEQIPPSQAQELIATQRSAQPSSTLP